MSSNNARRIARAMEKQAGKGLKHGVSKLGVVATINPITITPRGGAIPIPEDAMVWSNIALLTKDVWQEGDTVALSLIDDNIYLVHDVVNVGEPIEVADASSIPDHTHVAADVTDFDTQVRTNRIDQMAVPTAATPWNGQRLTGLGNASAGTDALNRDTADARYQAADGDLTAIAALTPTNDDIIQRKGGVWTNRSMAQLLTDLAITSSSISDFTTAVQGTAVGGDVTGTVGNIQYGAGSIVNADINAAAAIAYSKLNLSGGIVNADVNAAAAIAYSKLNLASSLVNADVAAAAAIAVTKLALGSANTVLQSNGTTNSFAQISNGHIAAAAGIAYSKLTLTGSIVNADVATGAAIAYSKLNLSASIVNADVAAGAAIAYSKLNLGSSIVNADVSGSAAIAYSKLNLASSIVNADVAAAAAIAVTKLAAGDATNKILGFTAGANTWTTPATLGLVTTTGAQSVAGQKQFTDPTTFDTMVVSTTPVTHSGTTDGNFVYLHTGSGTFNLPTVPTSGLWLRIENRSGGTVTIGRNGKNINGAASDYSLANGDTIYVVYQDGTYNWRVTPWLTLGSTATTAAAGNHTHAFSDITGTTSAGDYGAGSIVNADISATAEIDVTKLGDGAAYEVVRTDSAGTGVAWAKITNDSIDAAAAIAYSKLNLSASIVNADIGAAAAIAYSKLNLTGSIVNADVNAAAAIAYSKLNLSGSVVNADIAAAAEIAVSKLADGAAYELVRTDSAGTGVEWAKLTNDSVDAAAAIAYSKLNLSNSIVNADIGAAAAIAYSKLNLTGSIVNADIAAAAAIALSKLAQSGAAASDVMTWNGSAWAPAPAGTPAAHAASHIRGAADEINGDLIDIDFTGTNYTSSTSGSPGGASSTEHMSAHLNGIDTALGIALPLLGEIRDYAGFSIPSRWLRCDGAAISRTTYSALYAALTETQSVTTTNLSTNLVVASTSNLAVGMQIEAAGVTAGTTIAAIVDATNLTLSAAATASATVTARFFAWGVGNGTTTFNLPDFRGRATIGADNYGTTNAGRITGSHGLGGYGGVETVALAVSELPGHTHTVGTYEIPDHSHGAGSYVIPNHTHGNGTLAIPNHSHDNGSLAIPSHSHGAGTLIIPAHTHNAGTLTMPNHSHGIGTLAISNDNAFSATQSGAGVNRANASHTHTITGSTGSAVAASITGSTGSTISADGVTGSTGTTPSATAVSGTTGTTPSATALTGTMGATPSATAITGSSGTTPSATAITGLSGSTLAAAGAAATAHTNLQPYGQTNKIIYVGV